MKENRRKGFTLTELVVVLVILTILCAIAIPSAYLYIKKAEFRKNEENAKTAYLAAETMLTYYRSSGEWETFCKEVKDKGEKNPFFTDTDKRKDRIYAVTLDLGAYKSGGDNLVCRLLDDLTYDSDMLSSGAIAIEIDIETGQVYSAFYATRCKRLTYDEADSADGTALSMKPRAYDERKDRLVGYYSVEDVANVVDLDPVRLKVTSIRLQNSETLSLNWSSNSRHSNLDVRFLVKFYNRSDDSLLFSTTVDLAEMGKHGWQAAPGKTGNLAALTLTDKDGSSSDGWFFPVTCENGTISLVLDAMMSADVIAAQSKAGLSETEKLALAKTSSTSITRLKKVASAFAAPQDIYAEVQAESTYENMAGDQREYRTSAVVSSNTANTLYADGSVVKNGRLDAGIQAFRHLSNMRCFAQTTQAEFTVKSEKLDWRSVGVGMFVYDTAAPSGAEKLKWQDSKGTLAFPSIPMLSSEWTLQGNHKSIANLVINENSVVDDTVAEQMANGGTVFYSNYIGLFCESEGTISALTFENPSLSFAKIEEGQMTGAVQGFSYIRGVGLLAGRAQGLFSDVSVVTAQTDWPVIRVWLQKKTDAQGADKKIAAIGGIVGVLAKEKADGTLDMMGTGTHLDKITMSGAVYAKLPDPDAFAGGASAISASETARAEIDNVHTLAEAYHYGVGGIAGYARAREGAILSCKNNAGVSANIFAGGICGHAESIYDPADQDPNAHDEIKSAISDCENTGLILCMETAAHKIEENRMEGRFFGGILGFGEHILVSNSKSASGRASAFTYREELRHMLLGQCVGGILGYGVDSRLRGCSTQRGGYILGSDYVGGIVGVMERSDPNSEYLIIDGVSATVNAGYVIGNTYVGGIIGCNRNGETIRDCINNGVAAGYDCYVGGIVGYNGSASLIADCASYVSDYSGEIFRMIVDTWKATGDCTGGIAGYNDGKITFEKDAQKITVKSISGIVVGEDYVGGLIGFNDTHGTLKVAYTLLAGRIYAYGDCAGGCIGANASTNILTAENIVLQTESIEGRYCVGGVIGANLVNLQENTVMSGFSSDNELGTLTAQAFAGGVIGYQRSYTADQLGLSNADDSLYAWLLSAENTNNTGALLPKPDADGLTVDMGKDQVNATDANPYVLTITDGRNQNNQITYAISNLDLYAQGYVGGVVGYCEENSHLFVKNCRNAGNLTRSGADGLEISMKTFLERKGLDDAAKELTTDIPTQFAGGIIGFNGRRQVIDNCANSGTMTGFSALGGIAGLNMGGIFNCSLTDNFGNAAMDYVGGIVGCNVGDLTYNDGYIDVFAIPHYYSAGTVADCTTEGGRSIHGSSAVGGIAGYNLVNGVLRENSSAASISAEQDDAGGIAGRNAGMIIAGADNCTVSRSITSRYGDNVGGIAGYNEIGGEITVSAPEGTKEVVAVNRTAKIEGNRYIGGITGTNDGAVKTYDGEVLVCEADMVRAYAGNAGGIAGASAANISGAGSRCRSVSADTGAAGGILPVNPKGALIENCFSIGTVYSNQGYAGGIASENDGTIRGCKVGGTTLTATSIRSQAMECVGALVSVNRGIIEDSLPLGGVALSCSGKEYGGIAGRNYGTITYAGSSAAGSRTLQEMPKIESQTVGLSVGAAAGTNESGALVENLIVSCSFADVSACKYAGGIVGENKAADSAQEKAARVVSCTFTGSITETAGSTGSCYGGVAGLNAGTLTDCRVSGVEMKIGGVYTATSTSTAAQKEQLSTHAGGIAGKNDTTGLIEHCVLRDGDTKSRLTAVNGMLGGVTGYNKGTIRMSGDADNTDVIKNCKTIEDLCGLKDAGDKDYFAAEPNPVGWQDNKTIEQLFYTDGISVADGRTQLIVSGNGNLGGITAYNAPDGMLTYCATGSWFLNNKSASLGVGTGGIIGMNEAAGDQQFLLNCAFVGRQMGTGTTDRFAGGIIGNQNNTTAGGWTLSNCANYGTVYAYKAHYAGGIIGQWTGTGGTIEHCRNYGNLQTTHAEAWRGASGGIVAQLYHAQEQNEYNIVSCENYGSIYGQSGASIANCANDSAGILGNVTNYYSANVADSVSYTIRVLDCVNGPGVKIYSASMASGIVGFFSCDNKPDGWRITTSTANTNLYIERCRNFAQILNGSPFAAGIFGDRYGEEGTKKTYLLDNISVNPTACWPKDYPIVSVISNSGSKPAALQEHAARNYFLDQNHVDSFTDLALSVDVSDTTIGDEKNKITYDYANMLSDVMTIDNAASTPRGVTKSAGGDRVYVIQNQKTGRYELIRLKRGETITSKWATIVSSTGKIIAKTDKHETGEIICTLDDTKYNTVSDITAASQRSKENAFFQLVRSTWRSLEGADTVQFADGTSGLKLRKPKAVTASAADGQVKLSITPAVRADGEMADPFWYEVRVVRDGKVLQDGVRLYTEDGSFALADTVSGDVTVETRAVSMFDDVEPSDWVTADKTDFANVLPAPELRIELVNNNGTYSYSFTLANKAAYSAYTDWNIQIKKAAQTITLTAQNGYKATVAASAIGDNNAAALLTAQAVPTAAATDLKESALVSVPVSLPNYKALIGVGTAANSTTAKVSWEIEGATKDALSVQVKLDATSSNLIDTPPVYAVELVGTWKAGTPEEKQNVVFASQEVLISAKGTATAAFRNLPDTLLDASDVKVRVWYAQSGLGPVYTWHEADEASANVTYLTEAADGSLQWSYRYSTVLDNANNFANNIYTSETLFTWLPAPVLLHVTDGVGPLLTPHYDENGDLCYTFYWDTQETADFDGKNTYTLALYGQSDDSLVAINIDDAAIVAKSDNVTGETNTAYSLTVNADDWQYEKVVLQVTRIGDAANHEIGQSAEGTYSVRKRLPRPAQPMVANVDSDELDYVVSWPAIAPETGCGSYALYLQPYEADGKTLGKHVELAELTTDEAKDGQYQTTVPLDAYAGRRVCFYVVAIAEDGSQTYVNSTAGVTYEMNVLSRLPKPNAAFTHTWTYDRFAPLSMSEFLGTGLIIGVHAQDDASIPPGGSTYLLRAFVYEDENAAKTAITEVETAGGLPQGFTDAYVIDAEGKVRPVAMTALDAENYEHTLTGLKTLYAGKWLVLQARTASGGGQVSSQWVTAQDAVRLPYIRLDMPQVISGTRAHDVTAHVSVNPDLPAVEQTWSAKQTYFEWDSVEHADLYDLNLQMLPNTETGEAGAAHMLRIIETMAGTEPVVELQHQNSDGVWEVVGVLTANAENNRMALDFYSCTVKTTYTNANGQNYAYEVSLPAELSVARNADGTWHYTLYLPDAETLSDSTGFTVEGVAPRLTDLITFRANVYANTTDTPSDAYTASDHRLIDLN